jgi:aspartate racemase
MKRVGIIGGLGAETTAEFYLKVVFGVKNRGATAFPNITIASVELPFDILKDLIEGKEEGRRFLPYLIDEARMLESSGVDLIVMPCNTTHTFINEIRESVSVPVLSIVDETIKFIEAKNFNKIGFISSGTTIKNKVYEKKLVDIGVEFVVPNKIEQEEIFMIIQNLVDGIHLDSDRKKILNIINNMKKQGAEAVCLACTDLQLLFSNISESDVFDTMEILANATIENMML